ncbi:hypothetical protein ES702_00118 [subsurface metagenome]
MPAKNVELAILFLSTIWSTMQHPHNPSVPNAYSISTCLIAHPIPILLPTPTWHRNITDEIITLQTMGIFDLPKARSMLELDQVIEQHAQYNVLSTTRRYWDLACLVTNFAESLRVHDCSDLVHVIARSEEMLRLEESRIADETSQFQMFHDQVAVISDGVAWDAQAAQRVQFSGEDDPILLQQNVWAEDSLIQWTHLPIRLMPHFARTREICDAAVTTMTESASPVHELREQFKRVAQILSSTPNIPKGCQEALHKARIDTFATTMRILGIQPTDQPVYLHYAELFGLGQMSLEDTGPSRRQRNITCTTPDG